MLKVANLTHTPTQTHQLLNNGNSANTSKHKARSKLGLLPIDKIYMTNIKDLHYYYPNDQGSRSSFRNFSGNTSNCNET